MESGLPNNQLTTVPTEALAQLQGLDRLDLSYNKLKSLENDSFEVRDIKINLLRLPWIILLIRRFYCRVCRIWLSWNWATTSWRTWLRLAFNPSRLYRRWDWEETTWMYLHWLLSRIWTASASWIWRKMLCQVH